MGTMGRRALRGTALCRRKAVHLCLAYVCVALFLTCIMFLPRMQPQTDGLPDPNRLSDPCKARLSGSQHVDYILYRRHHVLNKQYQQAVWEVLAPAPRDVERFVIAKNWTSLSPDEAAPVDTSKAVSPDVVLAVQCSPDRLPFVNAMTQQWKGPFALALYIPAPLHSQAASACRQRILEYLRVFSERKGQSYAVSLMYSNGAVPNLHCDVKDGVTGFERPYANQRVFQSRFGGRPWYDVWNGEYPVNQLRTLARSMVREDKFLFLTEADFMVPYDMHGKLLRGAQLQNLRAMQDAWSERQERVAMILPAFERRPEKPATPTDSSHCAQSAVETTANHTCFLYNQFDVANDKTTLRAMIDVGKASMFYNGTWNAGHGCYDPQRWLAYDQLYETKYANPCEPYFIALAATMPPFEPRFKGRGRNKVTIITHMDAWGFKFTVNPDLFLLHLPHSPVLTLMNMSSDANVHINMLSAPYALSQVVLENAAREAPFKGEIEQFLPGFGDVVIRKAEANRTREGAADLSVVAYGWTPDGTPVDVDDRVPSATAHCTHRGYEWLWCEADQNTVLGRIAFVLAVLVVVTVFVLRA